MTQMRRLSFAPAASATLGLVEATRQLHALLGESSDTRSG
jgi:hypothetical protein